MSGHSGIELFLRHEMAREAAEREAFLRRCGVTEANAHEFVEIRRPMQKPLIYGGTMHVERITPTDTERV